MAGGWLHAGRVGRPHGLDGSFHVAEPNAGLLPHGAKLDLEGVSYTVVRRSGTDARPIIRLSGVESRSAAEALRGRTLRAPREAAPPLEADEWWAEDLEGCRVTDGEREVGTVQRVMALPSCEILEVARSEGGGELLVPLVGDAVRSVDVERREIDIDLEFLGER